MLAICSVCACCLECNEHFFPMREGTSGFLFFSARLYINLKLVHGNTFINVMVCYITLIDQPAVHIHGIRELFLITMTIMLLRVVLRLCLSDLLLKDV